MSRTGSFCRWRTDLIIVCNEKKYNFLKLKNGFRQKITELDNIWLDIVFSC